MNCCRRKCEEWDKFGPSAGCRERQTRGRRVLLPRETCVLSFIKAPEKKRPRRFSPVGRKPALRDQKDRTNFRRGRLSGETLVEVRRVELLSEDSGLQLSPSAAPGLTFPSLSAPARAGRFSSFIVPACGKAYAGPFPTSMTSVTQAVGA